MADTDKDRPTRVPQPAADEPDRELFLARWSRLKREGRKQPAAKPQPTTTAADSKAPAPELPPLDKLTFDSDFRAFFHPKVDENMRRAALKKLFSDPRFNVMDGLDVYIDDYSKSEPIPAAMLAQLKQAEKILKWAKGDEEQPGREEHERGAGDESPRLEQPVAGAAPAVALPTGQSESEHPPQDASTVPGKS